MLNILLVIKNIDPLLLRLLNDHKVDLLSEDENLLEKITKNNYQILLLEGSVDIISSIKNADPRIEIFLIGGSDVDEIEAVKVGATACFKKPVDIEKLKRNVESIHNLINCWHEIANIEKQLSDKYTFAGIIGKNPRMLELFNYLRRIAPYFKTVTILGETGAGKEVIARGLHSISPAAKHPFVVFNCGAFVESLIESELFGHEKGAFTGATSEKKGIFEVVGEGTVFLDEIGDLPLTSQTHLLRVLQNGDYKRVGSNHWLKARCRIIAATHRDLANEVKKGNFREDLFFRLTPLTIRVPSLRERKDDIPLLSRYILNRFCQRTGKKIKGISLPAQTALISYDWPGNIRELESMIEHIAILTNESFIKLEDLPAGLEQNQPFESFKPKSLDQLIKNHIEETLRQYQGNKTETAKVLGISRRTLFRKMEKYSIE